MTTEERQIVQNAQMMKVSVYLQNPNTLASIVCITETCIDVFLLLSISYAQCTTFYYAQVSFTKSLTHRHIFIRDSPK